MNDVRCPRCGGQNPPNSPFCGNCGTPLTFQQPSSIPPPPYQPPFNQQQPPVNYYPPPVLGPKVMGNNTRWALVLAILAFLFCGPIAGGIGFFLAKKDLDEIRAGRAPQLDEKWAKWAYNLNIIALVLWICFVCIFFAGRTGPF